MRWLEEGFLLSILYNLHGETQLFSLMGSDIADIVNSPVQNKQGISFVRTSSQTVRTNINPPLGSNSRSVFCVLNDTNTTDLILQGAWTYGTDTVGAGMYLWQ